LKTKIAAETNPADGELVRVTENRDEFLKLQIRIPVTSKDVGRHVLFQKMLMEIKLLMTIQKLINQSCW
jgi:hypothetical protein